MSTTNQARMMMMMKKKMKNMKKMKKMKKMIKWWVELTFDKFPNFRSANLGLVQN